MTEYMTKLDRSIKAIDANVDQGKKTQAGVEAENFVFGTIPNSDYLTCVDSKKDAAYVVLKRGKGVEQEIQCSCQYFKDNPGMTCEHLLALRAVSESDYAEAPKWLVTFLDNEENWHIVDGKFQPPSMDDDGEKPIPEPEKKPKAPKWECPHCGLKMAENRSEKHLSVCKKNPANQKLQGSQIPPTPKVDIGVGDEEVPVIDDGVPLVDEEGQEVYEKPTIEEGEIADSQTQETIPREIAKALCNMQKTELFATTDSDNPFFSSKYADLASIWRAIRVPLTSNDLAIMQTTEPYQNGITVVTTLMHISGAAYITRLSGTYSVTIDKKTGKAKAQTVQALGSLITYLRRYSLAALVGVASADDDGEAAMGRDTKNKR